MPPTVFKGNKREVPPDMPIGFWVHKVREYELLKDLAVLPWTNELLEYLPPADLVTMRAKALIWREVTGEWPGEIWHWWEIRMARRRNEIPQRQKVAASIIDEEGILHCGHCAAGWSPHRDGSPHDKRCKLCGCLFYIKEDRRKKEVPVGACNEGDEWAGTLPLPELQQVP